MRSWVDVLSYVRNRPLSGGSLAGFEIAPSGAGSGPRRLRAHSPASCGEARPRPAGTVTSRRSSPPWGLDRPTAGYAHRAMTIGTSLLLIAVGAILKYAVTADVS